MSDPTDHIVAGEEARVEENKRFNSERQLLLYLAPEKWGELKELFDKECRSVSERSHRIQLECEDVDRYSFYVNRMVNGSAVVALALKFDPIVPRIFCTNHWGSGYPETDVLGFVASGSNVFLTKGKSGVILPQFVATQVMKAAR